MNCHPIFIALLLLTITFPEIVVSQKRVVFYARTGPRNLDFVGGNVINSGNSSNANILTIQAAGRKNYPSKTWFAVYDSDEIDKKILSLSDKISFNTESLDGIQDLKKELTSMDAEWKKYLNDALAQLGSESFGESYKNKLKTDIENNISDLIRKEVANQLALQRALLLDELISNEEFISSLKAKLKDD